MRPARPDLLPVDDPVAAAIVGARRLGAQSRKVRAGGRFGEELAPGDVALQRRLDEARLLLGSAMFRDHGQRHAGADRGERSEEHTSELQSLMRISYAVFCLTKKKITIYERTNL